MPTAKRAFWPWIIGAAFLGWLAHGDNRPSQQSIPSPSIQHREMSPETPAPPTAPQPRPKVDAQKGVSAGGMAALPLVEPGATSSSETTMYVDANRLNVREGPGTAYRTVWTLKRDEQVTVIDTAGDWRQLRGARYSGWVHGGYLTPKRGATPTAKATPPPPAVAKPRISDAEIVEALIARSIGVYRGACPCPYSVMRNGRRCGGNSAWSKPGGASPLCFPDDVSPAMIAKYRARQ